VSVSVVSHSPSWRVFSFSTVALAVGVGLAPLELQAQAVPAEIAMSAWVEDHRDEALELLEELTNLNSYTLNVQGVREVADVLTPRFKALGFDVRWIDGSGFGRAGHLFAERRGSGTKMLLIGHLDTVFRPEDPFQTYERIDEATVKGPGVSDMKGGLVAMLQALEALESEGLLGGMNLTVAMIGDEERIGSPRDLARGDLVTAAEWADVALGFEGLEIAETAAVARRGGTGWTLTTTGTRGHSSRIFTEELGYGAIFEAARILDGFREELAGEEFLTFNPGIILGGSEVERDATGNAGQASGVTNVVAETATVTGDLRTISAEQGERVIARMREIASRNLLGTSATLEVRGVPSGMPPRESNYRLHAIYDQASRDMGIGPIEVIDPMRLGGADITSAAPYVDAALAAIGGMGAAAHSFDETLDLRAMEIRTKLAAVFLLRLSQGAYTPG